MSGGNRSAASEIFFSWGEITPSVVRILQPLQFGAKGLLGEFGQSQPHGMTGQMHGRVAGFVEQIVR
jgi:hypothetical protein